MLHVHSGNLYGGVETFLRAWVQHERAAGVSSAFALCFPGRLSRELEEAGGRVHVVGPVRVRRPWTVLAARRALRALLRQERFDVALTHSPWSQALFGPELGRARLAQASYAHGPLGRHWLERWAGLHPPGLVIANSRHTAGTIANAYPAARVEVCFPMVSVGAAPVQARQEVRAELGVPEERRVIIQVSRMESLKGHRLHLAALAQLAGVGGWECWMVGGAQRPLERVYVEALKAWTVEHKLSGRVRWLGERWDVPRLLAAADIYCQPNQGPEGFGITFIEALAAGLPVVSTAMGGALEVVDASCGVLVEPQPEALAIALCGLVADASQRRRLGEAGPARARALTEPAERLKDLRRLLAAVSNRI